MQKKEYCSDGVGLSIKKNKVILNGVGLSIKTKQ